MEQVGEIIGWATRNTDHHVSRLGTIVRCHCTQTRAGVCYVCVRDKSTNDPRSRVVLDLHRGSPRNLLRGIYTFHAARTCKARRACREDALGVQLELRFKEGALERIENPFGPKVLAIS
jgi:hypothetical protein